MTDADNLDEINSQYGAFPIDFIVQTIIEEGLELYRSDVATQPNLVFGQLLPSYLKKYGQEQIDKITSFIANTNIAIVQHFSLIHQKVPCFSIQLMNSSELEEFSGLDDHAGELTVFDEDGDIDTRKEEKYAFMNDAVQIGIHNADSPDLTKFLYYFLINTIMTKKLEFITRGLELTTWDATDISILNNFIPEHVYSRFVNLTIKTQPMFLIDEELTIIDTIIVSDSTITGEE